MFKYAGTLLLLVAVLSGIIGCLEKNANNPENAVPEIPQLVLFRGPSSSAVPEALKNSIEEFNAKMATGYTYLSIATISSPNENDNHYVWQVSAGGFTAEIEAIKEDENTVSWTVTISGSDGSHSYDNWVALQGTSNMEGTEGSWHIFAENSTNELGVFSWSVDDSGVKTGTFQATGENYTYEIINNPDGSGSFIKREGTVKVYEAVWDASGKGSWTLWDTQGNVQDSGSWS